MKTHLWLATLFLVFACGAAAAAQGFGSTITPPSGYAFHEGDSLCFSSTAPAGTVIVLSYPVGTGARVLYTPFYPDLDNGRCLPRKFIAWDEPQKFAVDYIEPSNHCETEYSYFLQTPGGPKPENIVLAEVSFRRSGKKYYLRVVSERLSDSPSCVTLSLGTTPLAITRYENSPQSTTSEALLGKEDYFNALASGPLALSLADTCSGKIHYTPALPPGKTFAGAAIVYIREEHKVLRLSLSYLPVTGCGVIFYNWWNPLTSSWDVINLPTYLDYDAPWDGIGRLPPSHRKLWKKGGWLVFRLYDYFTGEFVGINYPTGGH